MSLWISLLDVATGGRRSVSLGTQQGVSTVEIEIPLGINDGDNVQYEGIGPGGADLVVQFRINPDARWQRDALNLTTDIKVSIWDLILGSEVTIQTITGKTLTATISPKCQPGTTLRLKGQGLQDRQGSVGDIFLRVQAQIPENIPPELIQAIETHRH
jgi:DnaJ-class molecular chaperone